MWEFNHTDELYHGKHKYIAKIGEGVKARYFYTQEALAAYKKALSSKDEKAAYLDPNNPVNQFHGGVVSTPDDKQKWEEESAKRDAERKRLREDYERAKTLKGKAEDVSKVFNERNPETAKKLKRGKDFVAGLFR